MGSVSMGAFILQDRKFFSQKLHTLEKLIVFIVPSTGMSGGIMSIFAIAKNSRKFEAQHNCKVLLMTEPNNYFETYYTQKNFKNNEVVFRFSQIEKMVNLKKLMINIPEYFSDDFYDSVSEKAKNIISSVDDLKINIMNQNIELMPEKDEFADLYYFTNNISQTVAHHRYCSQELCNKFKIRSILLPAFIDVDSYPSKSFKEKDDIISYSIDKSEYKTKVLQKIKNAYPKYRLKEIKNMSFEQYMDIVASSKYVITFGEGYDGYLSQPMHKGTVSFAVYNDEFFPSPDYKQHLNIFASYEDMLDNIVNVIGQLDQDEVLYNSVVKQFVDKHFRLYSFDDYLDRLSRFYHDDFDFYPK